MEAPPLTPEQARETAFDGLVALACALLDAPAGLISIAGPDQTTLRSVTGLDERSIRTDVSVTRLLVDLGPGAVLVIPDAAADPRTRNHPLVAGPPHLRFYAGAAITDADGRAIGSIGVMDRSARGTPDDHQMASLKRLAQLAGQAWDQQAVHRRLKEQVETLQLAEQMAGVGHWRLDKATGRVDWSDEVYRIHGLKPGSVDPTQHSAIGAYHPDDQAQISGLVKRALETGEGYDCRLRLYRADGQERSTRSIGRTERDANGDVIALFGVFQDVTDRERDLIAIERSEARFRLITEHMGDVVARIRPGGRSSYISPTIERMLGYTPDSMAGRTAQHFVHPDDRPAVTATIFKGFGGEASQTLQHRAVHRDGHAVWVETHFQAVPDDRGGTAELIITIRDITARKAMERQMIEARERAESADRAKSEFLSNMSHELRTPLTSVIGFAGLLQESDQLPERERAWADRISTASEVLLGVINDILDYSKLEADAVDLDPIDFSVAKIVREAADLVAPQCEKRGVRLVVELAPDTPDLSGDAGKLRQVMLNFLSNAAKFTSEGEIRLRAGTRPEGSRHLLRVEVSDSGIGIPPDKIARLFDRFTQADSSTTRTHGGTGLGLAICQRLIDMMGGRIGAASVPGQGSTFWYETPLAPASGADIGDATSTPAEALAGRVLLADDAPANRDLLTLILERMGMTVEAVSDGAEAVQAARTGAYDLILMDVHMPVMDGLEATRAIRSGGGSEAETPIVALTANVQPEHVARCLASGMDAHVGKPVQVRELAEAITRALARNQPAAQTRARHP